MYHAETHQTHGVPGPRSVLDGQTGGAVERVGRAGKGGICKGRGGVGEECPSVGCVFTSLHPLVHDTAVDKRQEKARLEAAASGASSSAGPASGAGEPGLGDSGAPTSTRHSTEEMDADGDRSRDEGGGPLLSVSAQPPPSTQGPAGTGGKRVLTRPLKSTG